MARRNRNNILAGDEVLVPGTIVLLDPRHVLSRHAKNNSDIVLVPTPSDDPEDPLNWAPLRKTLALSCMLLYVFAVGVETAVLTSILVPFSTFSTISIPDLINGNGYSYLLAGWGLLFWQPFALQYGKRLTYLATFAGVTAINIWMAYCRSNTPWIIVNVLSGFFAATVEALPENTIVDLYFTHERGSLLALYALALIGGSTVGGVIAGFICDALGPEWVFFIPTIFGGGVWIFMLFFMEETNYNREATGMVQNVVDSELVQDTLVASTLPTSKKEHVEQAVTPTVVGSVEYKPKTFFQKLSLVSNQKRGNFWFIAWNQVRFATWPVVLFSGFMYGLNLVWTVVFGFTSSTILSAAPYNFSASMVGLTGLAALVGIFASVLTSGKLNDIIMLRLVKRNDGVYEPEMRLWLFTIAVILIPASIILWGVGAAHGIPWMGLMTASALLAFANTLSVPLSVNYVIDSYRDMAGAALTVVIIIRNTMYFAISYGISPWIGGMGMQNAYILCAFIALITTASFLIMVKWGKEIRQKSAVKYWALRKESMDRGVVH